MSVHHFDVTTEQFGYPQLLHVHVYDSLAALRAVAKRWSGESHLEAGGCLQSAVRYKITPGEPDVRTEIYHMRLQRERLGSGLIVHEVNHAVMAMLTNAVGEDMTLGEILTDMHEKIAYAHSDLTIAIVDALYTRGYFTHNDKEA